MISAKKIENLTIYMKASAEFDFDLMDYINSIRNKRSDSNTHVPFIMGTLMSAVTRSLINPMDESNTPEINKAIEVNKLLGGLDSIKSIKESVKALDTSFNNKHTRIFKLLKTLEANSTITDDVFYETIAQKDQELNVIVTKYVDSLTKIFCPEESDDPLNSVVSLSLFAIQAIRMSIYSHGVEDSPDFKTLEIMLHIK